MKQEDEWDRPHIVRFYDIVSDREIEKVKELAKPRVSHGAGARNERKKMESEKEKPPRSDSANYSLSFFLSFSCVSLSFSAPFLFLPPDW